MKLWTECLNGNRQAWAEMKRYNIHDVLSTEELYTKIQAWAPQSMPSVHHICAVRYHVSWGARPYKGEIYKRMFCRKCREYFRGDKIK